MQQVLEQLLSDTRPVVERLLTQDLQDPAQLRAALDRFGETLAAIEEPSLADLATGTDLLAACLFEAVCHALGRDGLGLR
jgi:hypothetical protein